MGKYIHKYTNLTDFENAYDNVGEVTALTVSGGYIYTACGVDEEYAQTSYDGLKFVFDRIIENQTIYWCNSNGEYLSGVDLKVFKNGNTELYAFYDSDDEMWSYDFYNPYVFRIQNLNSFGAAGDADLVVSSLEYGFEEEPADGTYYRTPWVSATKYNPVSRAMVSAHGGSSDISNAEFECLGLVDWERGLF